MGVYWCIRYHVSCRLYNYFLAKATVGTEARPSFILLSMLAIDYRIRGHATSKAYNKQVPMRLHACKLACQWPDLVAVPRQVLVFDGDAASAEEALAVLAIGPRCIQAHGTLHSDCGQWLLKFKGRIQNQRSRL